MAKNTSRSGGVFLERNLLESEAFNSLRTGTAYRVFLIFYRKRQMAKLGRKGKGNWVITNNGEITFSYAEAERKYGISYGAFRNAIDELMKRGFLDIEESGVAGEGKALLNLPSCFHFCLCCYPVSLSLVSC